MGWSARIWSHFDLPGGGYIVRSLSHPLPHMRRRQTLTFHPHSQMQICLLVIAPTFFSAALYWAGGLIIADVAAIESSASHWLSPKWFSIIFLTGDFLALVIQGIGGGMAGSAPGAGTQLDNGTQCVVFFSPLFFPLLTTSLQHHARGYHRPTRRDDLLLLLHARLDLCRPYGGPSSRVEDAPHARSDCGRFYRDHHSRRTSLLPVSSSKEVLEN